DDRAAHDLLRPLQPPPPRRVGARGGVRGAGHRRPGRAV
ncbi:MAG: Ethanolamine permease, partial [uncultured Frankineae bacterium]